MVYAPKKHSHNLQGQHSTHLVAAYYQIKIT